MPKTLLGSWIDQGALFALADDLCPHETRGEDRDGTFETAPLEKKVSERLGVIREAEGFRDTSLSTNSAPEPEITTFDDPGGALTARLEAFRKWAETCIGEAQIFVVDTQGDPLVVSGGGEDMQAAAVLLADTCRRVANQIGAAPGETLRLGLQDGRSLSVLPVPTPEGLIVIGVCGSDPITEAQAEVLREGALATVL